MSYNSYLIDDETVALIDTVDACYFEVYLRKIKSIIGERPIQYLIINHMEPDHSGSIRLIKQHYPDIVIVGNKQTFGMIEGYYGVTGEQYIVKDEDFLALGHHKLRFYLTPHGALARNHDDFRRNGRCTILRRRFRLFRYIGWRLPRYSHQYRSLLGRNGALLL